jgi:hypothetical protein
MLIFRCIFDRLPTKEMLCLLRLTPYALRLTIKNLSYILWCIVPQVKRSSNEVLLDP